LRKSFDIPLPQPNLYNTYTHTHTPICPAIVQSETLTYLTYAQSTYKLIVRSHTERVGTREGKRGIHVCNECDMRTIKLPFKFGLQTGKPWRERDEILKPGFETKGNLCLQLELGRVHKGKKEENHSSSRTTLRGFFSVFVVSPGRIPTK